MYTGFLLITIVACVVFDIVSFYTEHRLGKRYDFLKGAKEAVDGFVMISFTWWILARYFDGLDSKFVLWLLAGLFGLLLAAMIGVVVNRICEKIWPDSVEEVESVKMSKGLQICQYIFAAVVFLCFAGFVGYGIFLASVFHGILENVIAVLGLAIFAFGGYNSLAKIAKLTK